VAARFFQINQQRDTRDMNSEGDSNTNLPQFSRAPGRDVLGKLDDRLPEIRVPYEVRELVERTAREDGLDVTAWMRELIYARVLGPKHLAMLYQQRAERVLGNAVQNTVALRVVDPMRGDGGRS
jgi:hypothetical protein